MNRELLEHAASGHSVFHCLPAYRGKEITEDVLEHFAPVIFREAETGCMPRKPCSPRLQTPAGDNPPGSSYPISEP